MPMIKLVSLPPPGSGSCFSSDSPTFRTSETESTTSPDDFCTYYQPEPICGWISVLSTIQQSAFSIVFPSELFGMRSCLFHVWTLLLLFILSSLSSFAQQPADDPFALGVRTTEPLTPEQQHSTFSLPQGFSIELVAAEPDIAKPMNLAIDAQGRLWVSSSLEYPFAAADGDKPRDTIRVLQDTNADGRADKVTVFADELNIPIGLIPYGDGVICFSIPNIWYLRDTDHDGRCDKREILYGPFDTTRDTHGMCNAFRRGDDGWIYACHGFNNRSNVAGRDGHRVVLLSGNTFRFRPDGSRIELYTQGQVNPFGMSIDQFGDVFTADCHTKPVTLLLPGGCYDSFGRAHDGLGYVPNVMEHLHGSTAIAALALGSHLSFPQDFVASTFDGNVMTSRINRNNLKRTGSSLRAVEQPDLVSSTDPWFRPVDLVAGPDGSLYIADFYNRIIGHYEVDLQHPGRDRYRGRIWRVTYTGSEDSQEAVRLARGPSGYGQDLSGRSAGELLEMIRTAPEMQKRLARDVLADDVSPATTQALQSHAEHADPVIRRYVLRLLTLRTDDALQRIETAAQDSDETVRVHAFRALRELPANPENSNAAAHILRRGFGDLSAMVRRAAVAAASTQQSESLILPLLRLLHTTDLADVHLKHSTRIALRDHLQNEDWFRSVAGQAHLSMDRLVLADLSVAVKTPAAAEFVAGNIQFLGTAQPARLAEYLQFAAAHVSPDAAEAVVIAVRERFAADDELQRRLLESMRQGFAQRGQQSPNAVRAWAMSVVLDLLRMKSAEDFAALDVLPAVGWSYRPHPDSANAENCWGTTQSRQSADGVAGATMFSSFEKGESRSGIYRSAEFSAGQHLSFFIAGHDGMPDKPLKKANFVRLRDAQTNQLLREASPPRNDVAQKVEWNMDDLHGRRVFVELVDGDTASAYAWIAVGRFSDERLNPSDQDARRFAAAAIAGDFTLHEMRPALAHLMIQPGISRSALSAIAVSILRMKSDSRLAAAALIPSIVGAPDTLVHSTATAIANDQPDATTELLESAFQVATAGEQLLLAEQLAADVSGAAELLRLMEQGKASARLLLKPTIQQRLKAISTASMNERAGILAEKLPSEDSVVETLLVSRRASVLQAAGSSENGRELFRKNCQICHQLAGEGKQVGPNLDGIGNRGLDRVLEDLLTPNRNVDVAFRTTTVVTNEGKAYSGLLKELEGNRISIVDSQAKETILQTDIIEERLASNLSPMPSNLAETFNEEQLRDLVSFLLLQKKLVEAVAP
jgi:putative heme-binding domain-containing protein